MYKLNRKININAWTGSQDVYGGTTAVPVASYEVWAQVEERQGNLNVSEAQNLWSYDYKVVFRYEESRKVGSNFTIDYDSKRLTINSLSIANEAHRKFYIARCSAVDAQVEESGGGSVEPIQGNVYKYTATGGESGFIANDLRFKTIISVHKDGVLFEVILTGSPTGKKVLYNSLTGQFTFPGPLEAGEYVQIFYQ